MGRILDLANQLATTVGVMVQAAEALEKELKASKDAVKQFDLQKQALDNIIQEVSTKSVELVEVREKVEAAKELRRQLTALQHGG